MVISASLTKETFSGLSGSSCSFSQKRGMTLEKKQNRSFSSSGFLINFLVCLYHQAYPMQKDGAIDQKDVSSNSIQRFGPYWFSLDLSIALNAHSSHVSSIHVCYTQYQNTSDNLAVNPWRMLSCSMFLRAAKAARRFLTTTSTRPW